MHQLLRNLWREEGGQDLVEYTLLIAFLTFATAGFMSFSGESIKGIVSATNTKLTAASTTVGM